MGSQCAAGAEGPAAAARHPKPPRSAPLAAERDASDDLQPAARSRDDGPGAPGRPFARLPALAPSRSFEPVEPRRKLISISDS